MALTCENSQEPDSSRVTGYPYLTPQRDFWPDASGARDAKNLTENALYYMVLC
jgi:hypothetical protein